MGPPRPGDTHAPASQSSFLRQPGASCGVTSVRPFYVRLLVGPSRALLRQPSGAPSRRPGGHYMCARGAACSVGVVFQKNPKLFRTHWASSKKPWDREINFFDLGSWKAEVWIGRVSQKEAGVDIKTPPERPRRSGDLKRTPSVRNAQSTFDASALCVRFPVSTEGAAQESAEDSVLQTGFCCDHFEPSRTSPTIQMHP